MLRSKDSPAADGPILDELITSVRAFQDDIIRNGRLPRMHKSITPTQLEILKPSQPMASKTNFSSPIKSFTIDNHKSPAQAKKPKSELTK